MAITEGTAHFSSHSGMPLETSALETYLGSNNPKYLLEEVIANSPLTARAVARMGNLLGIKGTKIFVPKGLDEMTKDSIASEGAEVIVVDGDYDESVRKAHEWGEKTPGGMLIEGIAFEGYEDVPRVRFFTSHNSLFLIFAF